MKKNTLIILLNFFVVSLWANNEEVYQTQSFQNDIKSLQIKVNSTPITTPVIRLHGSDYLNFYFDQMSHEGRSYSYEVVHCNADWTQSSLSFGEYIDGFNTGYIDDYENSLNTTFLYTNYTFQLPNENTQFLVSGNYAVKIFEDNDEENPVCTFTFRVLEDKVKISGDVRTNTDIEINGGYQQVDFDIYTNSYTIQNAQTELKVFVEQNERRDNIAKNLQPTYYSSNQLSYKNNPKLIFEAGNEYRRFDISSRYNYDERVRKIEFINPHFNALLQENYVRKDDAWQTDQDVNGKFIINFTDSYDGRIEADYYYVHFLLNPDDYLPKGNVYIGGNYNYNRMDSTSKMNYSREKGVYYKRLLLKQGGYNYMYWFLPKNKRKATLKAIEGSFWQTENEYIVYVYHRPFGSRYDQLIGMKKL